MPRNKTDNFLKAIKRYAKQQKNAMQGEVEQLKSERLKEAEAQARAESDRIIKDELSRYQTQHTALLLFRRRRGDSGRQNDRDRRRQGLLRRNGHHS